LKFSEKCVLHTSCVDPAVKLVVELCAAERDRGVTVKEYAISWGLAQLYTPDAIKELASAGARAGGERSAMPLFFGTPRLLLFLQGPDAANPMGNPAMDKAMMRGAKCVYAINRHSTLDRFKQFLPEHQIVGVGEMVRGKRRGGGRGREERGEVPAESQRDAGVE
jgi:hypothetical protein